MHGVLIGYDKPQDSCGWDMPTEILGQSLAVVGPICGIVAPSILVTECELGQVVS